jgi:hypothetical protein
MVKRKSEERKSEESQSEALSFYHLKEGRHSALLFPTFQEKNLRKRQSRALSFQFFSWKVGSRGSSQARVMPRA